ncbi:GntR family transcriptional regulator [Paenibacillus riograndensis]|uniref:Gluconate operon transcriptional repressor, GntR family protein n=1 Tax=Paenibacillus riograndensis SBR5 TaxID=1073571 RepID=A0A0E4CU09_9BACL|nr:GntR family transcriptional regulator [Paenibacillus riograndensis]CQR51336.1 gluconate operon transcriptional repressor, GntR family protein [Paenibacillus riograndensis SBR5]
MHYPATWLQGASLGESIACELRLQIINEHIKPGEVLSENRIAADFGTSRSPVREALKSLSGEGLIRLERMGAVVVGLNIKDVKELYDVRYLIESFAQQRLAVNIQDALIQQLEQSIDKMKLAVKHNDYVEFALQDFSFHEAIVTEANHTRILHLWNSIRYIVMTVILITTEKGFTLGEARMNWVADKHRTVVEALRSGDPETIHKVVKEYFADSGETLIRSLP